MGKLKSEQPFLGSGAVYTISGISGSPQSLKKLDAENNAVMKAGCPINHPDDANLYCRFSVPSQRKSILRRVCKSPHREPFIAEAAANYLERQPDKISMVHAFRYKATDSAMLSSHGGKLLTVDPKTATANLHIWSDPTEAIHESLNAEFDDSNTPFDLMVESITDSSVNSPKLITAGIGGLNILEGSPLGMHHYEKYSRGEREKWPDAGPPHVTLCTSESKEVHVRIVHCMALFIFHPKEKA